jgi:hypothetical protein
MARQTSEIGGPSSPMPSRSGRQIAYSCNKAVARRSGADIRDSLFLPGRLGLGKRIDHSVESEEDGGVTGF